MDTTPRTWKRGARWVALSLALSLAGSVLAGCGRETGGPYNRQPPVEGVRSDRSEYPPQKPGLSAKQKVAILAGAAALYYLYNKHKQRQGQGAEGQYYLSKNGRVYYRDRNGNPVWVTPPREGIQVPESEAQQYSRFRGYNGRDTGETFGGYGAERELLSGGGPPGPPGPGR